MDSARKKKKFYPGVTVVLLMILTAAVTGVIVGAIAGHRPKPAEPSSFELYDAAFKNALIADEDNVFKLVCLNDDQAVKMNDRGQVMLVIWNNSPYTYVTGESVTLAEDEVWAVTYQEMLDWFVENYKTVDENGWDLRLAQLMGKPPDNGYTYFATVWAYAGDVFRPAYHNDVNNPAMSTGFFGEPDTVYEAWFNQTFVNKFMTRREIWTRLGYTYDWAPKETDIYGLSEFVIRQGSEVMVDERMANAVFAEKMIARAKAVEKEVTT
ncbi:hypothetical protein FACS18949_04990 [Clostridia bacterium]|nr:hypothetical protein FACS189425_03870 [Clostridia bacterium]GHV32816.1 hypothetical protein FACS18949_04990 [Clostridia bacterium]